jgi:hypothetical protein
MDYDYSDFPHQDLDKVTNSILDMIVFVYVDENSAKRNIRNYLEEVYSDGYFDGFFDYEKSLD